MAATRRGVDCPAAADTRMIVTWRRRRAITKHDERRLRCDIWPRRERQLHIHVRPSADFYMRHASTMVQWQPLAGRHGQRPTPRTRMINLAHSCTFARGAHYRERNMATTRMIDIMILMRHATHGARSDRTSTQKSVCMRAVDVAQ